MLRNARDLQGYVVHATDGDIGHIAEFYFDDEHWIVRYLVVDTGDWFTGHRVLIANNSIGEASWDERKISLNLTREQIEGAPGIETNRPVTRQHESAIFDYFGWPYYWGGAGTFGIDMYPAIMMTSGEPPVAEVTEPAPEDSHLQSTTDVRGFHIKAADGEIGHVEDFIVDDDNWTIRYIEVDTRNLWPGKKVLLAPSWIKHIDWKDGKVCVNLSRNIIQNAPAYDHSAPITRQYEVSLFEHYGQYIDAPDKSGYWNDATDENGDGQK